MRGADKVKKELEIQPRPDITKGEASNAINFHVKHPEAKTH